MKLKKIASLMLAGVMAVSMLTACGEGDSVNEKPNQPEEPTTPSGYSEVLYKHLSTTAQKKVTASDSDAVNNALLAAMEFMSNGEIGNFYDNGWADSVQVINNVEYKTAPQALKNAAKDLIDSLAAENKLDQSIIGAFDNVLDPTTDNYNKTDRNVALLFVTDGGKSADAVMDEVASMINAGIESLQDDFDTTLANGSYVHTDYDYTISVGAYTKTLTNDHGKSMTFVAVNIARV